MLDYAEAQQGFADDEDTGLQAHFTNTPGAIADLDGDGETELIMVGSVQNAAQTDRERGVALCVVHRDGTRPAAWETPFHVPAYLAGLEDLGGNIVGADQPGDGRGHRPDDGGPGAGVRGLRRQDPRGQRRATRSAGRSRTPPTRPC